MTPMAIKITVKRFTFEFDPREDGKPRGVTLGTVGTLAAVYRPTEPATRWEALERLRAHVAKAGGPDDLDDEEAEALLAAVLEQDGKRVPAK